MFSVQPFVTCKGLPTQLDRFGARKARKTGQILQSQDSYADKLLPECVHLCNQFIVLLFFLKIFLPPPVSLGMTKIRGTAQAEQSGDKVGEVGLRWFGHDERWRIYWTKDVDDGAC